MIEYLKKGIWRTWHRLTISTDHDLVVTNKEITIEPAAVESLTDSSISQRNTHPNLLLND